MFKLLNTLLIVVNIVLVYGISNNNAFNNISSIDFLKNKLQNDENLIYLLVGDLNYHKYIINNSAIQLYNQPPKFLCIDINSQENIAEIINEFNNKYIKYHRLIYINGIENINESDLYKLNFLFRITDSTNYISNLMILLGWHSEVVLFHSLMKSSSWKETIGSIWNSNDNYINGNALAGRIEDIYINEENITNTNNEITCQYIESIYPKSQSNNFIPYNQIDTQLLSNFLSESMKVFHDIKSILLVITIFLSSLFYYVLPWRRPNDIVGNAIVEEEPINHVNIENVLFYNSFNNDLPNNIAVNENDHNTIDNNYYTNNNEICSNEIKSTDNSVEVSHTIKDDKIIDNILSEQTEEESNSLHVDNIHNSKPNKKRKNTKLNTTDHIYELRSKSKR